MSERTLFEKVSDLKALKTQRKAIEEQMEALQKDIRKELQARGQEETKIGDWMVKFKAVISNEFNAKTFVTNHPRLYQKYRDWSQAMRFTVNAQG